jgi:hypothetical protein
MNKLVDANGRPITADEDIKLQVERLNNIMIAERAHFAEEGYTAQDLLNICINTLVQQVMEQFPNDPDSCTQRARELIRMIDSGLGQALTLRRAEFKIQQSLASANDSRLPS